MIDVVFISDLHLHPEEHAIQARFDAFIEWAKSSVKKIYILGDFFHAWAGDDSINAWSSAIAKQIKSLTELGIPVFYLRGNRDFLSGKAFARLSGWEILEEPAFIELGQERVMLVHGDSYCTKDLSHQRFRRITRNKLFTTLFLSLPLSWRERLVDSIRAKSQITNKSMEQMDVVSESVIDHMNRCEVTTVIHGHTHRPGLSVYETNFKKLSRYVLSDWDDNPQLLCYNNLKSLFFEQM